MDLLSISCDMSMNDHSLELASLDLLDVIQADPVDYDDIKAAANNHFVS